MIVNLILQVEYNENMTNDEEVANAIDQALKTALSTPGLTDNCGTLSLSEVVILEEDELVEDEEEPYDDC